MVGSKLARNEGQRRARRSFASTTPADLPPGEGAWLSDRPGWCVDLGPSLVAMTTCDLWLALARGDVAPQMKVWREGMPYWQSVAAVPEFALALPDAPVWTPEATKPPVHAHVPAIAAAAATAALAVAEERERPTLPAPVWSASASVVGVTTMIPLSDLGTPAPMVVEHRTAPPPPSGPRRRFLPKVDRRGAASVAIGAALAVFALAIATSAPAPTAGPLQLESPHAASMGAPEKGTDLLTATAPPKITAETPRSPLAAETAIPDPAPVERRPRGPHASDRGQHRARAGSAEERVTAGRALQ